MYKRQALAFAYYHKPLQNSNKPLRKGKLSSKMPLALAAAKLAAKPVKPVRPANYFMYTKGNSKLRGCHPGSFFKVLYELKGMIAFDELLHFTPLLQKHWRVLGG